MGRLDRWAEREQHRAEQANRAYKEDPSGPDRTPGPAWAWAIGSVPILHWIGDAAIAWGAWRRRKNRRDAS